MIGFFYAQVSLAFVVAVGIGCVLVATHLSGDPPEDPT